MRVLFLLIICGFLAGCANYPEQTFFDMECDPVQVPLLPGETEEGRLNGEMGCGMNL